MSDSDAAWALLIGAPVIYELYKVFTNKSEDTLTAKIRKVFRTYTRPGKFAFLVVWGFVSAWLAAHIVGGNI